ncbi:MAG: nitroreductase/quinone reductase family protein [Thermoproteota archaeon]|nr:nitroreductase/quinone reductase family protein [Thermoproteota archaeon]
MSKADLFERLDKASETITLTVKGRKSGSDIPRPVWFVHESNTLYLLPNYGSDTNWYKNFQANPTLKISVSSGEEIPARGTAITDSGRVKDVLSKFSSKYGDVTKYYPKPDVAVQVPL